MVSVYSLNPTDIGIIASGVVIYIAGKIIVYILDKKNLTAALYYIILHDGIAAAALIVLFSCICKVDVFEFFSGFSLLGWMLEDASTIATVSAIAIFFVKTVSFILLQSFALQVTYEALTFYHPGSSIGIDSARRLMISSISVSAIMIAIAIYVSDDYIADTILFALKQYISIFTCTIALYVSLNFPKYPITDDAGNNNTGSSNTATVAISSSQDPTLEPLLEGTAESESKAPIAEEIDKRSDVDPVENTVSSVNVSSMNS